MIDAVRSPTAISTPHARAEIIGIQYLRGIAAMMVVAFHLVSQFRRMGYDGPWLGGLSSGVDIFFVISGFIMVVTTANKSISPIEFWTKRIVRIVPLYWLVTAFMTAVLFIAPRALQTGSYDGWHLLSSYLFIPAIHPVQHSMEPLVTPGWTLNYEMFFYLIFGLFLLAPARVRFIGTAGTIGLLVILGAIFGLPRHSMAGFYTYPIMLEFVLGMALGEIAKRGDLYSHVPVAVGWVLLVGGLLFLILPPPIFEYLPRPFTRGPFAAAVVAGTLTLEAHRKVGEAWLLREVGNASYSIYITQIVLTSALSQVWRLIGLHHLPFGFVAFAVVDLILCAIGGWLCYRLVELPLTHMLRPRRRDVFQIRAADA